MLYYGNSSIIPILNLQNTIIFNLTSYKEGLDRLNLLPPIDKRLYLNDNREFDLLYAQWVFNNDNIFFDFFKIVYNLYIGNDVFLAIDESDWSENLIESILKLIQQRYGYNGILIDSIESYLDAQCRLTSSFTTEGLYNLDLDLDRYTVLFVRQHPEVLKNEDQ